MATPTGVALLVAGDDATTAAVLDWLTPRYARVWVAASDEGPTDIRGPESERLAAPLTTIEGQARIADWIRQTPDLALVVNVLSGDAQAAGALDRQLNDVRRFCDATVSIHNALRALSPSGQRPVLLHLMVTRKTMPPHLEAAWAFVRGFVESVEHHQRQPADGQPRVLQASGDVTDLTWVSASLSAATGAA